MMDEEKMIDEAIDEIIGMGQAEREAENGGGTAEERAACRRCSKMFARKAGSTRTLCPDCFAASHRRKKPAQEGDGATSVTADARLETTDISRAGRIVSEARRLKRLADAWGLTWEGLGDAMNAAYLLIGMVEGTVTSTRHLVIEPQLMLRGTTKSG